MVRIIIIRGTCPSHMITTKLAMKMIVDVARTLRDLYLLFYQDPQHLQRSVNTRADVRRNKMPPSKHQNTADASKEVGGAH